MIIKKSNELIDEYFKTNNIIYLEKFYSINKPPMISHFQNKYYSLNSDDIEFCYDHALASSIKYFDNTRGIKFTTYLYGNILTNCNKVYLRDYVKIINDKTSLDFILNEDDTNCNDFYNIVSSNDDTENDVICNINYKNMIDKLLEFKGKKGKIKSYYYDVLMIEIKHGKSITQHEKAKLLGIKRSYYARILKMLKEEFFKDLCA